VAIQFRFNRDPDNGELHCWNRHMVSAGDAIEAWYKGRAHEKPSYRSGVFSREAKLGSGRRIRVIWFWLKPNAEVYVITAYDLFD
jgi:hypothetical protein